MSAYKPTVAILGSNGTLGQPILKALTSELFASRFQLPIRVITRSRAGKEDTETLKYYEASVDDVATFKPALAGVDVFFSLVSHTVSSESLLAALKVADSLKVYIPSQYGCDIPNTDYLPVLAGKTAHSTAAREQNPLLKVVDVYTALFSEPGAFLDEYVEHAGLFPATKKAVFRGPKGVRFNVSTFPDIANAVSVIASTPPSALRDTYRIYSDTITQEDVLAKYEASHNTQFDVSYVSAADTLAEAEARLAKGFDFKDFFFYLQTYIAQGEGKGLAFETANEREVLNPNQSLWQWQTY